MLPPPSIRPSKSFMTKPPSYVQGLAAQHDAEADLTQTLLRLAEMR